MNIKPWIIAARLRTLPLAFASILVGTTLAGNAVPLNYSVVAFTFLTAILLQVLSNFANDYGDAVSGVDSDKRKGPERMVHSGAISPKAMRNALIVFTGLTLISGVILLATAFPQDWLLALLFFLIGVACIAAAIKYTVGSNPYGYVGLGDAFVFIFFGLVAVLGTYFLQTKSWDWLVLLPAASLGFFAVGVLNVNNIRDITSDEVSGKMSIPVRLGKTRAAAYHAVLLTLGVSCSLVFIILSYRSWPQLLFLPVLILFTINVYAVARKPSDKLDPYLKQMAISTLLFAILFSIGQLLSWFF